MTAKKSGASPDKRRKYDDAFRAEALRLARESRSTQAAARQLGISPKLLYRWQPAQLVAEVGREAVARDPEVRALRPPSSGPSRSSTFKKVLVIFGQPTRCAPTRTSPSGRPRCPFVSSVRCCA